jgi:hypothetical protein
VNISYILLIALLGCFVGLLIAQFITRRGGAWYRKHGRVRRTGRRRTEEESLRTMVEDRYGSACTGPTMKKIEYRSPHIPRYIMRSEHDQLDNKRETVRKLDLDTIATTRGSRSSRTGRASAVKQRNPAVRGERHAAGVKAPWGW